MNLGMLNMLKSMGIDPEKIIGEVKQTLNDYGAVVVDLKAQMNRMEANQKAIMAALKIPEIIPVDPLQIEAANTGERKHG